MAADRKEDLKESLTALIAVGFFAATFYLAPDLPALSRLPRWLGDGVTALMLLGSVAWLLRKYGKWVWGRLRGRAGSGPSA